MIFAINNCNLTMINTNLVNCNLQFGGCIYLGSLTENYFNTIMINNCFVDMDGGCIFIEDQSSINANSLTLTYSIAGQNGGCNFNDQKTIFNTLTTINCVVNQNGGDLFIQFNNNQQISINNYQAQLCMHYQKVRYYMFMI